MTTRPERRRAEKAAKKASVRLNPSGGPNRHERRTSNALIRKYVKRGISVTNPELAE